jgi:hypothetical protein
MNPDSLRGLVFRVEIVSMGIISSYWVYIRVYIHT